MSNVNVNPTPQLLPVTLSLNWQRAFVDWLTNLASSRTRRTYLAAWCHFLAYRPITLDRVS